MSGGKTEQNWQQCSPSMVACGCRREAGDHNLRIGCASIRGVTCLRVVDKATPSALRTVFIERRKIHILY